MPLWASLCFSGRQRLSSALLFGRLTPILTEWDAIATIGLYSTVHKSPLCECTFDKVYLFICKHLIINRRYISNLGKTRNAGVGGVAPVHTYTLGWSLACALVREGLFLKLRMVLLFWDVFVKINQTSLHDDITRVSRFDCTWVHLGLHLKCACVFIHNLQ